jgi:RNA polymerase sigma-70 factor (ECF subfamily)
MAPDESSEGLDKSERFNTTRWSLILSSGDGQGEEEKARDALAELCRIYWRPVFAFVCRHGRSAEDAQDLTQEFFLMILKTKLLQRADAGRGRFRSLMVKSLQNFLSDVHGMSQAEKRGGKAHFVAWDDWLAEAPSRLTLPVAALETWPAERIFDVRWAATVAERAFRRLQEECEKRGRRRVFDALSGSLTAEREEVSYETLARELGAGTTEIKRLMHQLRRRYRELLRAEVAETVENPEDVDSELRYLVGALVAGEENQRTNQ